jgi:alpha-ketoglutarate-dependent taurine dioxygenase
MLILPNRKVLYRRDGFDPNLRRVMHRIQLAGRSSIAASGFQPLPA